MQSMTDEGVSATLTLTRPPSAATLSRMRERETITARCATAR